MTPQLVWFKRDLRTRDHYPLLDATKAGPVLCLYVYEQDVITAEDYDARHLGFINDSLRELDATLQELGGNLIIRRGDILEVLEQLHLQTRFGCIRAHQETGNAVTYRRDLAVIDWCRRKSIDFIEYPQNGVVRRLAGRDGWASRWQQFVALPQAPRPDCIEPVSGLVSDGMCDAEVLGVRAVAAGRFQRGGESRAFSVLKSFLNARGETYRGDMSSPVSAEEGCSRLSAHIAYGNISIRQVHAHTTARQRRLRPEESHWRDSLKSFQGRLRWHCHFMQKLEDEPEIEWQNMNRAFDGLREDEFDPARFEAWQHGQTGYPLVDACMRSLRQTGWVNFRMRAMVVSFASYHLWLHWPAPSRYLARLFTDYEPGIHYSQFQMQSGTTGINSVRIYSPIKQVQDQDPTGIFIRRWVPELARVPDAHLAEPHRMPTALQAECGCLVGKDYPEPIVEHVTAYREAKSRIFRARGSASARTEARRVYQRHGSRRRSRAMPRRD